MASLSSHRPAEDRSQGPADWHGGHVSQATCTKVRTAHPRNAARPGRKSYGMRGGVGSQVKIGNPRLSVTARATLRILSPAIASRGMALRETCALAGQATSRNSRKASPTEEQRPQLFLPHQRVPQGILPQAVVRKPSPLCYGILSEVRKRPGGRNTFTRRQSPGQDFFPKSAVDLLIKRTSSIELQHNGAIQT